jgi:multiple sugar transport system ATP-binding protein
MTMGHRIAIMRDGELQQVGPPQEVYDRPANVFVARFIGTPPMNVIQAAVVNDGDSVKLEVAGGTVVLPPDLATRIRSLGTELIQLGVRAEALELCEVDGVPATVSVVESLGHDRLIVCRMEDDQVVTLRQRSEVAYPEVGAEVRFSAAPESVHCFDALTGDRLDP